MNITFLIGNGFDRNLGLATAYSDFIKEYKKVEGTTETLQKFNKHIKENEEMWSSAEVALGQFTKEFGKGEAEQFSECHTSLCEQLALYLKEQEIRINYEFSKENIETAFKRVNEIINSFPTQEKAVLNEVYQRRANEIRLFNFICFNYTETLDNCLEVIKDTPEIFGSHTYNQKKLHHGLGSVVHVHGTVDKEMIFGVNDETQISKNDVFDCENGDLSKGLLIKQNANASYLENTDTKVAKIVEDSHIIYIYGMSIGQTDKLWWDRICKWLNAGNDRHLIIQKYEAPTKGVFPIKYQRFERGCRKEFTQYSSLDEGKKGNIESRIHITSENIFEGIKNIAAYSKEKAVFASAKNTLSALGVN